MKVISPGRWVVEALQLSMTSEEYREWVLKKIVAPEVDGVHLFQVTGKNNTMHYCSIAGQKVIVYELNEEAARLEQMEAAAVA